MRYTVIFNDGDGFIVKIKEERFDVALSLALTAFDQAIICGADHAIASFLAGDYSPACVIETNASALGVSLMPATTTPTPRSRRSS